MRPLLISKHTKIDSCYNKYNYFIFENLVKSNLKLAITTLLIFVVPYCKKYLSKFEYFFLILQPSNLGFKSVGFLNINNL